MTEITQTGRPVRKPSGHLLNLVSALAVGLIGFGFIHSQDPIFQVPEKYHVKNLGESAEKWSAFLEQQRRIERLNASAYFAVLGGALALALVLVNATCCSVLMRTVTALPLGVLMGAAAGFLGAVAHQTLVPNSIQPSVADSVKAQVALFATFGIGMGLVSGLFGSSKRTILGGVVAGALGGILAGMAFPIMASLLIPSASIETLIPPKTPSRLLWLGIGMGLLGLIIPMGAFPGTRDTTSTEPETAP